MPLSKKTKLKSSKARQQSWPHVYTRTYPSGQVAYVVDLGLIDGKRDRHSFKSKEEAETFAEQARIKRQNEGLAAFNLPNEIRADALRAPEVLKPLGVSVHQAALEFVKARQALGTSNLSLPQVVQEYAGAQNTS